MESSLSSRLLMPKKITKNLNNKSNSSQRLINKNISSIKTNYNTLQEKLNTSWDFTPFPYLYFPSQKNQTIRNLNGLNFKTTFLTLKNADCKDKYKKILSHNNISKNSRINDRYTNIISIPRFLKNKSIPYLFKENRGDITKRSSPAYSFGISREDCKFPFLGPNEKISPNPCSYNLRPLEGLGGPSLKYSINKDVLLKKFRKHVDPGPGYYNMDKLDIKNNGKIVLSDIVNSKISNFGKYEERKDKNDMVNEWNMKPEPGTYNINEALTMFTGSGKYPISKFRSNISKSIGKLRELSKRIKFIYPGPGDYNHYSIFKNIY